jgi:type II secretory pathway component GspD/PulD (secretin)
MKQQLFGIAGLAMMALALPLSGRAAETQERPRSVLEKSPALDKPVTYTETKIPLGELVQRVAADTGAPLSASPEVADEPVAVVVKELPARELLEQLADLLDYQWARRPGLRTPNTEHRSPTLEIYQDLASKRREAALREAEVQDAERRLQEEVERYAEVAALSPDQIQGLLDEEKRRQQEFAKLSPEEQARPIMLSISG